KNDTTPKRQKPILKKKRHRKGRFTMKFHTEATKSHRKERLMTRFHTEATKSHTERKL
ncbi:14637_t:CDS:1, partial [Dentiscutata erythropus]